MSYQLLQHALLPNQQLTQQLLCHIFWGSEFGSGVARGFWLRFLLEVAGKVEVVWQLKGACSMAVGGGLSSWPHGPFYRAAWVFSDRASPSEQSKQDRREEATAFHVWISEVTHGCFQHILLVRSESFPAVHTQGGGPRLLLWREGHWVIFVHSLKTAAVSLGCHIHSITYLFVHPSVHLSFYSMCFSWLGMSTVAGARSVIGEEDREVIPPFSILPQPMSSCY